MEIIDESNIRSRIRSYKYRISEAYDKPAESKFLSYLHMDKPRALLNKVKEELEERRRLGYGYKKYPVTVLRNKKGKWMEGYLEGYKKVSGIGIDKKCSYCEERKMPEYEYCPIQYLCKECVEELKSKYPTFGKE